MSKLCFIPLNEIDDQGRTFSFDAYEALGGDSKELGLLSFECQVKVHKAGDGYYINGVIHHQRELPCTVCGQDSFYSQSIKIEEFLRIDPGFDTVEQEVAKSDESNSLVVRSSMWNFKEFVRESILLEEPVQFYSHNSYSKEGSAEAPKDGKAETCPEYENLVKQGVLVDENENKGHAAFSALKNLRF